MSGRARDEDFDDRDRRNREKHAGGTEQDGAAHDADHDHERMKLDRTTENDRLVNDVLEQLGERHGHETQIAKVSASRAASADESPRPAAHRRGRPASAAAKPMYGITLLAP